MSFDPNLKGPTGSPGFEPHNVRVDFGGYEITVELGPAQEFLGIKEIARKDDFRSMRQRIEPHGGGDLSDIYGLK